MDDVDERLEDVLSMLPMAAADAASRDRLFSEVVDLLMDSILGELRARLDSGVISPRHYATELAVLASQARHVGLLTPPAKR
jgi:hypothetical protein